MSLLTRVLPDNPVLTKEMRVRMRGARAYWILLGYLGFLSLVLILNYAAWLNQVQSRAVGASEASRLGESIFNWLIVTQAFLVLFITPAITSGSITIEKEQRTLDMLAMTRLSRRSIIAGKLLAAVSFTALLLVSSLPLISICFMLGSVDPAMVVSYYIVMLVGSFLVGAMGLMWSSIARSTSAAVLYTYATLLVPVFVGFTGFVGTASPGGDLGVNLLRAVGESWFSARFLGLHGWTGFGFSILSALSGWLLAAIAMSRLESWPEQKAPLLRGLTLLLIGVQLLSVDLWWLQAWYNRAAQAVQVPVQPPIAVLILTAILLMLLVPIFATGEMRPAEARNLGKYLAGGWTPKGLARGRLASGLPFLLLVTLFALGLYALSFVFADKAGEIARSSIAAAPSSYAPPSSPNVIARPLPVPAPPAPTASAPAAQSPSLAGDFPQAAIVLLVTVAGFSLLCLFLSAAFRNRWVALCLAYLFLAVIWAAPELARSSANNGEAPGISINLYYFNPAQALAEMSTPHNSYWDKRPLVLGETPMWQATTLLWAFVGVASLAFTLPLAARESRRNAAIPYEEMATST